MAGHGSPPPPDRANDPRRQARLVNGRAFTTGEYGNVLTRGLSEKEMAWGRGGPGATHVTSVVGAQAQASPGVAVPRGGMPLERFYSDAVTAFGEHDAFVKAYRGGGKK